jgi:hypothetical protein
MVKNKMKLDKKTPICWNPTNVLHLRLRESVPPASDQRHMVAETSNPSPVTEPRSEARYEKKRRKA